MPGYFRKCELIGNQVVVTHVVDNSRVGLRADLFLCDEYPSLSRNKIQKMIEQGRVSRDGKRLKASSVLQAGEKLVLTTQREEQEPTVDLNYKILYEDLDLMVIDKPANLPVHPAGRYLFNTLLMSLRLERSDWIKEDQNFYLIHRIDRETSGILLLAKRKIIARQLVQQFFRRETIKKYYAVIHGHPATDEFVVDVDLGRDKNSKIRLKMAAFTKGKGKVDALTYFRVVRRGSKNTLLDCDLKTGRQHQIRVHLNFIGHPVVGDKLYGKSAKDELYLQYLENRVMAEKRKLNTIPTPVTPALAVTDSLAFQDFQFEHYRQALHSRYLRFFHPGKQEWMEIESPLPKDLEGLLEDTP